MTSGVERRDDAPHHVGTHARVSDPRCQGADDHGRDRRVRTEGWVARRSSALPASGVAHIVSSVSRRGERRAAGLASLPCRAALAIVPLSVRGKPCSPRDSQPDERSPSPLRRSRERGRGVARNRRPAGSGRLAHRGRRRSTPGTGRATVPGRPRAEWNLVGTWIAPDGRVAEGGICRRSALRTRAVPRGSTTLRGAPVISRIAAVLRWSLLTWQSDEFRTIAESDVGVLLGLLDYCVYALQLLDYRRSGASLGDGDESARRDVVAERGILLRRRAAPAARTTGSSGHQGATP